MLRFGQKHMYSALAIALVGGAGLVVADAPSSSAEAQSARVPAITAAEKKLGAEAHPQLLQEFGGAYQAPQTAYVVDIGKSIAMQSGLGNAREDFTVTLLNSPVNNAFAIPGGYIYVTRQLLGLMNDEAELAGVLGHEVGHVAARHSQKRQKAAQRNAILGILGQLGSALLLGDTALGQIGQRIFGTGSQLLTLRYSRRQEEEADDLGVRYLSAAGYDPQALSSMLASLAAQGAIDARVSGQNARTVPEWASTHPDPARRVVRAATVARNYTGAERRRDAFLSRLEGLLYGDDPAQGIIDGRSFLHPDLKLRFSVPAGYTMLNSPSAVSVSGQVGQAQFTTRAYGGDLDAYVASVFGALAGQGQRLAYAPVRRTIVNGLPAAYSTARLANGRETLDIAVFAYQFSASQAYHFVAAAPAGRLGAFEPMFGSVARLSDAEAKDIRPRRLQVVTVQTGDTVQSLSARMAFDTLKEERFRALNGLSASDAVVPGQRVKLVRF